MLQKSNRDHENVDSIIGQPFKKGQRTRFRSKDIGKTWKFLDYYSVTDATLQTPVKIRSREDLLEAFTTARTSATCHKMRTPNDVLQTCFPDRFVR